MENVARLTDAHNEARGDATSSRNMPQVGFPGQLPSGPLSIADMAELFGVTHRTLHFYEEKGLISAKRDGAMRVYNRDDVTRMAVVSACREGGMPVAVIQDMLGEIAAAASPEQADTIFREALLSCKRELTAGISTIRRQMQQIENLLNHVVAEHPASQPSSPMLSEAEMNCLKLMAEGFSPGRIATAFGVTALEAAALERDVMARFSVTNRSQAIAKALLAGLVSD